jgi:hypothetical protein
MERVSLSYLPHWRAYAVRRELAHRAAPVLVGLVQCKGFREALPFRESVDVSLR